VALDAIRDQPRAVELLRRALDSGRVAHAYAFVGPPGSGRMTTALAFAHELLSQDRSTGAAAAGRPADASHPDLHVIVPTPPDDKPKGPRAIRIDAIRELERRIGLRPVRGGRRVAILDEAERMTDVTPQAFLKFLEEPLPGTVIILVLPGPRSVPATVLSRCQIVRFQPRDRGRSATAVGEALALVEAARADGLAGLFRRTDRIDRDRAEALVDGCWLLGRDLLLARAGAAPALLSDPERVAALTAEAEHWTDAGLLALIEACRHARETLLNNVTPRLTVETVIGRLLARAA
jgi:DNA polymerase-3 subunit delta'